MPRTTSTDVANIIDTSLDSGQIDAWIGVANEIVDDIADADATIDSSRLEKIEQLTAAHLLSSQDQRIESTSRETASVSYQGDTSFPDFRGTKHGQAAIALDSSGTLSTLGKPTASVTTPSIKDYDN